MPKTNHKVVFQPDGVEIDVFNEGENLLRVAIVSGVHVNASCGGAGTCGKCKVRITEGRVDAESTTKLTDEQWEQGYRLACRTKIIDNITVEVPIESRHEKGVLARQEGRVGDHVLAQSKWGADYEQIPPEPFAAKYYVEMTKPTEEDNASDMARLGRALKREHSIDRVEGNLRVFRSLPGAIREGDWKVTATVTNLRGVKKVVKVEPGDTRAATTAIAVDIGTTTVHAMLIDCVTGKKIDKAADYNSQMALGEDVITRIVHAVKPGGLETLNKRVVKTLNEVLKEVFDRSGVKRETVTHMVFGGNTTMTQLFLSLNPKYIREAPYVPVANYMPTVWVSDLGIEMPNDVVGYFMPCVSSYVGGDITSGVLATEIHLKPELTLFMDVGTNGEIVIGNKDWMVSASASAGPAFEGGGVKYGMRASFGAIEQVRVNPMDFEPMIMTIGQTKPKGICGSGMIDCIAELQMSGIISQNGKFNRELASRTWRVREGESGWEYVICRAEETQLDEDLAITEPDIDNLVRTKASIYSACSVLLKSVGLAFTDVEKIIIAGGFGQFIDVEKAMTIGLLPEVDATKVSYGGNTSLEGCRLAALYVDKIEEVENIASMITNIELSASSMYMEEYVAALFLPHTRLEEFPRRSALLDVMMKRNASFNASEVNPK